MLTLMISLEGTLLIFFWTTRHIFLPFFITVIITYYNQHNILLLSSCVLRFKLKLGAIIRTQYNDEVSINQHIWLWFVRSQHNNSVNLSLLPFLFQWFTLNDIKHGRVHLVLEWLPTATQRDRLDQVSFKWRHMDSLFIQKQT